MIPTRTDPVARAAEPLLGGPLGERAQVGRGFWTPLRICIALGMLTYAVGWLSKGYCVTNGWQAPQRYMYLCYSDIPLLYEARGLADGAFPYIHDPGPGQQVLEYPVLTGVLLFAAAWVTQLFDGGDLMFLAVNVVAMAALFAWAVASVCGHVRSRPWDGLLLALAPAVALAAFVNWDLLAVSLTAASLTAWSRRHLTLSGVLLGLAAAAKFYPLVLVVPVVLLCLRRRTPGVLVPYLGGAAAAWLAVNVPIMLANVEGWARFYTFSRERGMDFGSPWYALTLVGVPVPADRVNLLTAATLTLAVAAIAVIALRAHRPPRLASLAFLVVAAFVLTNKVYSPQYVLWVLPLAILARPRWRDLLIWQAAEAAYFAGIWWFLVGYGTEDKGIPQETYALATAVHWVATAWLMGLVVRDILDPRYDPVRADALPAVVDDPGGGVLDGAGLPVGGSRTVPARP